MNDAQLDALVADVNAIDAADNGDGVVITRAGFSFTARLDHAGVETGFTARPLAAGPVDLLILSWDNGETHAVVLTEQGASSLYRLVLGHLVDDLGFAD